MNMENNKKMGIATIVNTAGAVLAYLIGAGFASGQEVMQFFSNWGSVGGLLEIGIIFVVFLTLTYIGVGYIGRTRNAANVNTLYEIIGGKIIGKVLSFFVWAYNLGCYFFMISGFGNVLNQQFGLSVPIGSAIAVVLSGRHGAARPQEDGGYYRKDRSRGRRLFIDPWYSVCFLDLPTYKRGRRTRSERCCACEPRRSQRLPLGSVIYRYLHSSAYGICCTPWS